MTTAEERVSRIEGILEQMNVRLGNIETQNMRILEQKADNERLSNVEDSVLRILEQKADKSEVRLLFATTMALLAAIIGLLGTVLARL